MRILPTRVHGVIDYVWSVLLIATPFVLGFATGGAKQWTAILFGLGGIAYSLLTRYELGLVPRLSMRTHLLIDGPSGALLALSPWLFGFADTVYLPHLLFGLFAIGASLITRTTPEAGPLTGRRA